MEVADSDVAEHVGYRRCSRRCQVARSRGVQAAYEADFSLAHGFLRCLSWRRGKVEEDKGEGERRRGGGGEA